MPPDIHFETLENGLTLLLRPSHLAPVVDLQIWAKVGSADESPDEAGLAHFHEHMLFKGTETRGVGEVAGEIEGAGGRVNAYTSFDTTVYFATLPSDRMQVGVDVLSDAVLHSRFDPEEIAREIEVVLEEIRRSDDSPFHVLGDAVFREAYQVHPYRNPILGSPASVASFNADRVRRFFGRWYAADNLVFVAAGDFDAADLAAKLRRAFADARPAGATRRRPSEPPAQGLRSVALARPFERVRMDLSWRGASFHERDAVHLDLLSFLLGECESSRLVQRVKERDGLVDRIDSGSYTPLDPGLFSITIEAESRLAQAALAATICEVEKLRRRTVSADELERARINFLSSEQFERESVSGQARKLGTFHVLGGSYRSETDYFDAIRSATPDDLLRVARQYLSPERLTAGVLLPESEPPALDGASIAACIERGAERARRAGAEPRLRSGAATAPALEEFSLAGGAKLFVLPRRGSPITAARAALLGGQLVESEETAGLTRFLAAMWMRGTRSRSAVGLARDIESLAADIDSFAGRNSLGVTLEVAGERIDPALDLFCELLLEPAFDAEEIERERRDTLAAIAKREDRLAGLAHLLFGRALFQRHPYRLALAGEADSVTRIDFEALANHHARLVHAQNLVIAVAGDVDAPRLADGIASRLSELPDRGEPVVLPEPEPAPNERRETRLEKDRAQTHLVLGFQGVTVRDPDRFSLEVMSQLLAGQGGRLFLELRDRQSLAYSVSAMAAEGVAPGTFSVYIASAPDKVEQATRGILDELARLREQRVPEDELERARRSLVGNFAIEQQRSASHAAHISLDALYGLDPLSEARYAESVAAVTSDDVMRVAQRILRLDAYTLARVGR